MVNIYICIYKYMNDNTFLYFTVSNDRFITMCQDDKT